MKFTQLTLLVLTGFQTAAATENFDHYIPLDHASTATYYIAGSITGYGDVKLLVDTGSTYSAINESILEQLQSGGNAHYLRVQNGLMGNGSAFTMSVYRIAGLVLGNGCMIHDVEVLVLPAKTRPILGLSTLKKLSPFIFSTDPPVLVLSNCRGRLANKGAVAKDRVRTDGTEDQAGQIETAYAAAIVPQGDSAVQPKARLAGDPVRPCRARANGVAP